MSHKHFKKWPISFTNPWFINLFTAALWVWAILRSQYCSLNVIITASTQEFLETEAPEIITEFVSAITINITLGLIQGLENTKIMYENWTQLSGDVNNELTEYLDSFELNENFVQ